MPCTAIKNADPAGTPGNRTPDKIQRLLNQVTWDTFAVAAYRFAVAGPDQAARRRAQVAAAIDDRPGQAGGAHCLGPKPPSRLRDAHTRGRTSTRGRLRRYTTPVMFPPAAGTAAPRPRT